MLANEGQPGEFPKGIMAIGNVLPGSLFLRIVKIKRARRIIGANLVKNRLTSHGKTWISDAEQIFRKAD